MDDSKIRLFLATSSKKFPKSQLSNIEQKLKNLPDNYFTSLQALEFRDPTTALAISIFAGGWGIDRFYLRQTGLGLLKLFTLGGLLIWAIVDVFTIYSITKRYNQKLLDNLLLKICV